MHFCDKSLILVKPQMKVLFDMFVKVYGCKENRDYSGRYLPSLLASPDTLTVSGIWSVLPPPFGRYYGNVVVKNFVFCLILTIFGNLLRIFRRFV
jgi:hypothetical protein